MRRKLQAKLNSKKGFTLVELLIVVAIIAILVAVSIPMVGGSLNKARVATDQANERAARAVVMTSYLMETENFAKNQTWFYDAENGTVVFNNVQSVEGYGQCSGHKDGVIGISITDAGDDFAYTMAWYNANGSAMAEEIHGING